MALASFTSGQVAESELDKRSIGLFSVVTFPNEECALKSDATMSGLCLSSTECKDTSGTANGNCASGFGVCCSYTVDSTSGGDVRQNITYIQNNGYPSTIATTGSTIDYNIYPVSNDICWLRFDFTALNLPITTYTGVCDGKLTITSPTGKTPPEICGNNANYHMYSEVGRQTTASKATITLGSTSTTRTWKIKVVQIECSNDLVPPSGCVQYYTGMGGTFESYNFNGGLLVANINYNICFRPEKGTCGMAISVDSGTTSPNPFCLPSSTTKSQASTTAPCGTEAGSRIKTCAETQIKIHNSVTSSASAGVHCGTNLNFITDVVGDGTIETKGVPFQISYTSTSTTTVIGGNGFKLNYIQKTSC